MIRVAILGATGYTALELIRILLRNPEVQITAATTRQSGSPQISSIHQSLTGRLDIACEDLTVPQILERADFAFCCLPHAASAAVISELLAGGIRVIDLSADYRLNDAAAYEAWYGTRHPDPARLPLTVYGLPELYRDRISGEQLIANPGCYTSTAILGLAPLLAAGLIEPAEIIIDAKSGVSGAGRAAKQNILFAECNESLSAYSVGGHRHQPEIEQVLSDISGQAVDVIFTPHLVPMNRGILATIYARPTRNLPEDDILRTMREFYTGHPFVRVVNHLPATRDVTGTNYCHLTARRTKSLITVLSVTDNLIKGASGVAVQNFNLMAGFPETTGLIPA
ncbi:MAG: N-acetyl-gamma-glutamyl-phosphate reductase [Planctomycetaceae bacterium]